ncbi:hypothetical protein HYG77_39005 (plasmid) [Rhodococcus sp. ZPP]|uniref:hypothetical protein n=1 Tax=Rhodococcus sp. ZPP TaxID=2749906 RepID=UPI001AD85B21|nr:hypothetical protein [Rhodococcus sp. ZPP]QTJ71422.1 hypothetical protein HYG77_39005 [Rhodococcus sp. ZPP]
MITWTLSSGSDTNVDSGTADDRPAAIAQIAEAARTAVLTATTEGRYTLTVDGEPVLILGMDRNELGKPNTDQALDRIDQLEATENPKGIGRGRPAEPQSPRLSNDGGPPAADPAH